MVLAFIELGVVVLVWSLGLAFNKLFLMLSPWVRVSLALATVALGGHSIHQFITSADAKEPVWADNARTWEYLPLTVWWDHKELEPYNEGIQQAMVLWNKSVGCGLFSEQPFTGRVTILSANFQPCGRTTSWPLDKHDAAGTWLCPDGTVEIQLQRVSDTYDAYKVFAHELGHVLGLAHDSRGIMSPNVSGVRDVTPMSNDLQALRTRYCR